MKKNMISLVVCLSLCQYSYAGNAIKNKYESVLFPDGIPEKTNVYGITQKPVFKLYAEEQLFRKKQHSLILYSLKENTGSSDDLFTVYLSVILEKKQVKHTENVTKHMRTFLEFPGNFAKMDGVINTFKISKEKNGIHVNLWSVISGTGSISSSTDLFYLINSDSEMQQMLSLIKSNSFNKMRYNQYESNNNYIYYGDVDGDRVSEIIMLESKYKVDSSKSLYSFELSPQLIIYKFNGITYIVAQDKINIFEQKFGEFKRFKTSGNIIYSTNLKILKKF